MFKDLKLEEIVESTTNPRSYFSEAALNELASSIKLKGVLQPIIVRELESGKHELVSGARRFKSAALAGLKEIPANIRVLSDEEVIEIQITENLQRENVNAMDEAVAFKSLNTIKRLSVEEIAARTGKSTNFVKGRLKLNDLHEEAKMLVYNNILPVLHATKIAMLSEKKQREALKAIMIVGIDKQYIAAKAIHELTSWMERTAVKLLSNAPFKLTDEKLFPEAGPCTTCPKATTENTDLFNDHKDKGCLDSHCYSEKIKAFISNRKTAIEKKHKTEVVLVSDVYWSAPDGLLQHSEYEEKTKDTKCEHCRMGMIAHSTTGNEGQELYLCVKSKCPSIEHEQAKPVDAAKAKKQALKEHTSVLAMKLAEGKITADLFDKKILKTMYYLTQFAHLDDDSMQMVIKELNYEYLDEQDKILNIYEGVTPAAMFVDNFRGTQAEIDVLEKYVALESIKAWVSDGVDEDEKEFMIYFKENILNVVEGIAKENEKLAKLLAEFYANPEIKNFKHFTLEQMSAAYKNAYSLKTLAKAMKIAVSDSNDFEAIYSELYKASTENQN